MILAEYEQIEARARYGANDIRPGLTGWAQINGRDAVTVEEKARLDGWQLRRYWAGRGSKRGGRRQPRTPDFGSRLCRAVRGIADKGIERKNRTSQAESGRRPKSEQGPACERDA